MDQSKSSLHVKDNRMFNPDGSLREEASDKNSQVSEAQPPKQRAQEGSPFASQESIDFPTFILSLASSAQISLGIVPNPITGALEADLAHAKQTIDIIGMLENKTQGNLDPEESGLLKQVLFQLRMQYVEISKSHK
jgi:hypothetical protein